MKPLVVVLSFAFAILGLVGVASHAVLWLAWFVLIVGVLGILASLGTPAQAPGTETYVSAGEGTAAGILWIVGLAMGQHGWLAWWTFAFAIAFIVIALTGLGTRRSLHTPA